MAVTAITTSGVAALSPFPGGYSLEQLDRMFLYGESPCQIATVNAVAADAWTSADDVSLLAAPGAGRSIYLWGAMAWANNTATPVGLVVLAEGAIAAPPVITSSIAAIPILGPSQPNGNALVRIGHTVTANTLVSGMYTGSGNALCKLRFFYAVI